MDPPLPPLIQQMLHPGFYPHPVQEPIQLLQTHISYVLLTGDYAYKVKKPVNFGFLDFTALAQRHYFCQEELRLNRRLSPDLYLAVLPITQDVSGQYRFAAEGEPGELADYAVQMRQFPQDALFSRLFQDGKLTPEMMGTLGRQIAEFHQNAATNAEIQSYGSVAAIRQVDANNFALSESFIGRSQTQTQYDATHTFTTDFFAEHPDWFAQRQRLGKIREAHGDLHLNNICLYQGKIDVFDCIEFNKEFRNIDVINDIAFTVMDLEFRGRPDLANILLNTYLEHTGDYQGAALLPLYLTMRAYIRGNVNSLALDDPAIADAEKAEFLQRGTDYYRFAWEYTQRSRGQVILMSGLSGSGKSTTARSLAPLLQAIHIRSDAVRKHLAGLSLYQRGDAEKGEGSGIYTPEMTQKTYDRLQFLGLFLVQQGFTVILDAKYDRHFFRQAVMAAAQGADIPVRIVQCTAPESVLRTRLQQRTGDIADATADLLEAQLKTAEPLTEDELAIATTIQTDSPLEPQFRNFVNQ
jgi:aminoglycoside phosphotransferase family enzyme/predicted kinase